MNKRLTSLFVIAAAAVFSASIIFSTSDFDSDNRTVAIAEQNAPTAAPAQFDSSTVPAYTSAAYVSINNGHPYFTADEMVTESYESYSPLDSLGRCQTATACVGVDIMPAEGETRGEIGDVRPSGFNQAKYPGLVDGNYLYNRCHLIAWELAGENANPQNLITGTRYLNIEGMLNFENMIADYVRNTNHHVMYRVTPVFEGSNLLCNGVLMEAKSVEDDGNSLEFCVFAYNVQPGVTINYATGESQLASESSATTDTTSVASSDSSASTTVTAPSTSSGSDTVWIPHSGKKYHSTPDCSNMNNPTQTTREDAIAKGYEPCKKCW